MSPRTLKLALTYDGTAYCGWQQNGADPSIEGTLATAIAKITQERPNLQAASRTDAGVHALGQVVAFDTRTSLSADRLRRGLNAVLPADIRVVGAEEVASDFHPTLDNRGKEYHYRLSVGPIQPPNERHLAWHIRRQLDLRAMHQAAAHLVGNHDFTAFCNVHPEFARRDPVRTIHRFTIYPNRLELVANSFLFRMARILVGTIVYVGLGKRRAADIPPILSERRRPCAGITAPAHGLTLVNVIF